MAELAGAHVAEALGHILAGGSPITFNTIAAWAAFVGVAAGLTGLFLYRGLREALTAAREANGTLKEALEAEKLAREGSDQRHRDELNERDQRHAEQVAACNLKIEGLTAKVELLQSSWVTEIALAVAHAVATAHKAAADQPRRGGRT
jgi:flavin-dependent dehydrogenase